MTRTTHTRRRWGWRLLGFAALLGLGLTASAAHADSNFERGFERELGRIAAHQAVLGIEHLMATILIGHPAYAPPPPPRVRFRSPYRHHDPHYGRPHDGRRGYTRHYDRDDDFGDRRYRSHQRHHRRHHRR